MPPNIRSFAKELIPPILLRLRASPVMSAYHSYADALADSLTYEDPGVIQVVSNKTKRLVESVKNLDNSISDRQILQNLFVMTCIYPERSLDVIELGGACGAMYFLSHHFLPGRIERWHVVETPSMVDAGKKISLDERLVFFSDLNAAVAQVMRRDLLMAQGVLQYTRDPLQTWHALFHLGCDYVYVTRTVVGINIAKPIITQQRTTLSAHGPGIMPPGIADRMTSQPLTIVPLESLRVPSNYCVRFSFIESDDMVMQIGPASITTRMIGFLLQKAEG